MTKRGLPRSLEILAIVVSAPMWLPVVVACAIAVRLESPGQAIFAQERTGEGGKRFGCYKFRTMVENADELKAELAHLNVLEPPDFKIPDDPRITRVGKFLRATSLDELPQLWNVLRGDMAIVGPRPTSFSPDTYELWHTRRLDVRPGLTGLWQVTGRHNVDFDDRVRLDARYIRQRSISLDLQLILRTFGALLRREGV
jgi:lipopolysaccharide/colanic/teichoic acid biosynthesis glycosyltransferase